MRRNSDAICLGQRPRISLRGRDDVRKSISTVLTSVRRPGKSLPLIGLPKRLQNRTRTHAESDSHQKERMLVEVHRPTKVLAERHASRFPGNLLQRMSPRLSGLASRRATAATGLPTDPHAVCVFSHHGDLPTGRLGKTATVQSCSLPQRTQGAQRVFDTGWIDQTVLSVLPISDLCALCADLTDTPKA